MSSSSTFFAEGVYAYAVDVELDAGLHAVAAKLIGSVEDADYGLADAEVVLDGDEVVEGVGEPGHDGGAAAGDDLEAPALHAILVDPELGLEGEVVDGGYHAVVVAAGEGALHLAGQRLGLGVADEPPGEGGEVRADVEGLVGVTPERGQPMTLRTVLPQASRVERPTSPSMRITSGVSSSFTKWSWTFSLVVT